MASVWRDAELAKSSHWIASIEMNSQIMVLEPNRQKLLLERAYLRLGKLVENSILF